VVSSSSIFALDTSLYPVAIGSVGSDEKVERHNLIITERKTDFYMDQFNSITNVTNAPFVFSYFENNNRFERCYIDAGLRKVSGRSDRLFFLVPEPYVRFSPYTAPPQTYLLSSLVFTVEYYLHKLCYC